MLICSSSLGCASGELADSLSNSFTSTSVVRGTDCATDRISDASALSGSRRSDASAKRTAESWAPTDSACRESSASAVASPRMAAFAISNPSRPSNGRKTPSLSLALRASSVKKAFSVCGVAAGISRARGDFVEPHSSCISSRAAESWPSIRMIESRSLRKGGSRPGSIRKRGSGASVESTTSSGQLIGDVAIAISALPASFAETASPGAIKTPPLALAIAARQGQLIWGPTHRLEKEILLERNISTTR